MLSRILTLPGIVAMTFSALSCAQIKENAPQKKAAIPADGLAALMDQINKEVGIPEADKLDQCKLLAYGHAPCGGP